MTPTVQLYYFGRFDILYQAGRQLEQLPKPPTQKSQSLLAYLVRHRQRPQPRERLMAMFWGERPEQRARRSLSTALWHIRRCFPNADPIQGDVHAVHFQFPGNVYLDVEAFETGAQGDDQASLQAAVALYQGEFLAGFYDDWIVSERYRLQSLYEEALAHLMVLYENQGQYPAALQTAQRLLEADNLREDAHRLVMRVYGRLGRRNAALEQYQRCQEIINRELGAEPMAETAELYRAIRDGRFEVGPVVDTLDLALVPAAATVRLGQNPFDANLPDTLVGRQSELDFLRACWHNALSSRVKLLLISGEAGVGKTQLVKGFATQLRQEGIPILWGRCYEFERLLPYQPIAEALRPLLATLAREELWQLPAWVLVALARLVPEVIERYEPDSTDGVTESPQTAPAELGQEQTHLFHAIAHFLTALASNVPVMLVLDDLHWATASTLALLHYLVRHLAGRTVMLVGTYRREAVGSQHSLQAWQQQLRQDGVARRLHLSRLPLSAVETWIVEMSGAGKAAVPLARRLYEETEGNPFFMVEMIKALFEVGAISLVGAAWHGRFNQISQRELPLPGTVRDVIKSRVLRLPPDAQEALRLAAVLGREFDFDPLNAVWQRSEEATLSALGDLLRARLVDEGTGTIGRDYAFTHHKIQEVVYAGIPQRRRQRSHARTAETMETLYAYQLEAWLSDLAFHYEQGQQVDKALTAKAIAYLRLAGEQAAAHFANSEAINYFSRALSLTPSTDVAGRYDLLLAREEIHDIQGMRDAQAQDLAALEQLAQTLSDEQRAEVALRRANYAEARGDYPAAIQASEVATALAQKAKSMKNQAMGYLQQGRAWLRLADYLQVQVRLEEALSLARAAHLPKIEADSLRSLGIASYNQGNFGQAKVYYEQALSLYRAIGDRRNEGGNLNNLGLVLASEGQLAPARRHYEQALRIFQETGDQRGEGIVFNNLGIIARRQGDLAGARAYYEGRLAIARKIGDRRGEGIALSNLGVVARNQGEYAQATNYHERALHITHELGDRTSEGQMLLECAINASHQGNYSGARSLYEQCLEICREVSNQQTAGWAMAYLGLLSHHVGDREAAREYSHQALTIAQELDSLPIKAYALTNLGHALAELDHLIGAADIYQQAIAVHRELGQLYLSMEPLAGLARVRLVQQNLAQARAHVDEILKYLEDHTLNGTEEPFRVYLTCYRVLHTVQDSRAPDLLQTAHRLLQERAAKIKDEQLRHSFLENVSAHREIIAAFSATESN
ncbi:MAG TPA: tetratricopeptide repeat protein [Anaerolineae bacterium]